MSRGNYKPKPKNEKALKSYLKNERDKRHNTSRTSKR
jgi:hypothetical protein